jgi:hypothetical protein
MKVSFVGAVLIACLFGLTGCPSSQIRAGKVTLGDGTLRKNQKYKLEVSSGNTSLDGILYEHCYRAFSELLPIVESGTVTGTIAVKFGSDSEGYSMGYGTSTGSAVAYSGYGGTHANAVGSSMGIVQDVSWQNSTMIVVIKRADGSRIWSCDYDYKGGWEMSGYTVKSPAQAARLVSERIADQMKIDFDGIE